MAATIRARIEHKIAQSSCIARSGLFRLHATFAIRTPPVATALAVLLSSHAACAEPFIVEGGRARAEIITADQPPPIVTLAARELQTSIEKISGARLSITNRPSADVPVRLYVGRSAYTDPLNVTDAGLKHGAYRVVSGPDYLVLLGIDTPFDRPGKAGELLRLARHRYDSKEQAHMWEEWYRLTGEKWGLPYSQLWKMHNVALGISELDEHGSFNAVCDFLRSLGVRWYMPDPLGEVIPHIPTIALPAVNKTVQPDFPFRYPYQYGRRFGSGGEEMLWQLRMGFNEAPDLFDCGYIAHGTALVIQDPEVKAAHPEYYAFENGRRITDGQWQRNGKPCLSSEALIRKNVEFVRAMYDIFDAPMVSVMPTDGFASACQCDLCKGKATPERGWNGQVSDYVWAYVDRVAREVYQTHPDRKVIAMGYGTYLLPPEKIEKLSPNIVVCIAQHRYTFSQNPEEWAKFQAIRQGYFKLLPAGERALCTYDYYLYARPNTGTEFMPVFFPHAIAKDLHALKDISMGDYIEVYRDSWHGFKPHMSVTHLNLYVTGRYWWDADQDIDALLDEYYTLFYGPAHNEMKAFIEYAERNWMEFKADPLKISACLELLDRARRQVAADSVYGKRIALLAEYVRPLRDLARQLTRGRTNVPDAYGRNREVKDFAIDGKLDDAGWQGVMVYSLRELRTGRQPVFQTNFRMAWAGDNLYVGIVCADPDTNQLTCTAGERDDPRIDAGDSVRLLLETQSHSYYELTIDPAGALRDVDRKGGTNTRWSSGAEVASAIGANGWSAEARIPVVRETQEEIDAQNGLAGRKPIPTFPWYFNVYRQRIRPNGSQYAAFAPTGRDDVHDVRTFAMLYMR